MEEEYDEMRKECLIKVCLLWGDGDMDPLVGQGIVEKHLTDLKELFGFEY